MNANPNLSKLMAYPFERLNNLLAPLTPNSNATAISLSIGEPKHHPPDFALEILSDQEKVRALLATCLLYTSPSPRDRTRSRMPSSA